MDVQVRWLKSGRLRLALLGVGVEEQPRLSEPVAGTEGWSMVPGADTGELLVASGAKMVGWSGVVGMAHWSVVEWVEVG